jgi:hypothetical protein
MARTIPEMRLFCHIAPEIPPGTGFPLARSRMLLLTKSRRIAQKQAPSGRLCLV